jgi:hypothetical protein
MVVFSHGYVPKNSFSFSSKNISLQHGVELWAECNKGDGTYKGSFVNLALYVGNNNGRFQVGGERGKAYQGTCKNIHLETSTSGYWLVADCQKEDGSNQRCKLLLDAFVGNEFGDLKIGDNFGDWFQKNVDTLVKVGAIIIEIITS